MISRRLLVKLYVLMDASFRMVAFHATPGTSMIFQKMLERVPEGSGYMLPDAAYGCKANCQLAADRERLPEMDPQESHVIKGFSARAVMLRWFEEDPGAYKAIYNMRSNFESPSLIKARLGHMVRAKNLPTQTLDPAPRCIAYSMTA